MLMKLKLLFALLIIGNLLLSAQELNCNLRINSEQVQGTNKSIFATLEKSASEFVNNRKWSDFSYAEVERIECFESPEKNGVKGKDKRKFPPTYINPANIAEFLRDYNQNEILKTTCHEIDSNELKNIKNFCETESYDFVKHRELVQSEYKNNFFTKKLSFFNSFLVSRITLSFCSTVKLLLCKILCINSYLSMSNIFKLFHCFFYPFSFPNIQDLIYFIFNT